MGSRLRLLDAADDRRDRFVLEAADAAVGTALSVKWSEHQTAVVTTEATGIRHRRTWLPVSGGTRDQVDSSHVRIRDLSLIHI